MEIRFKTDIENSVPKTIEFNYEELASELDEKLKNYEGKIETDETNYQERKADRANLNAMLNALSAAKKRVKKILLSPMESGTDEKGMSFNDKIDDLTEKVQNIVSGIADGIKAYEDSKRDAKRIKVLEYLKEAVDVAFGNDETYSASAHFQRFAEGEMVRKNNAWLNATCSMESVKADIDNEIGRCTRAAQSLQAILDGKDEMTKRIVKAKLAEKFSMEDAATALNQQEKLNGDILKEKMKAEKDMAKSVMLSEKIGSGGAVPDMYACGFRFVGTLEAFRNLKEYLEMNKDITYTVTEEMHEL